MHWQPLLPLDPPSALPPPPLPRRRRRSTPPRHCRPCPQPAFVDAPAWQPSAPAMAWGAPRGIDDLVERVRRSDPTLASLCVLRMRRVDEDGCRSLAEALAGAQMHG